ncbi:hypothetical protein [Bradyrhizobium diazoefficiens]|uniref:hypothetical protein n=1 Tax=Bradyrhizobium diazoefficiens TaxID=1355477 RepID=UPI0027155F99|nr:hypothetical protein [Bradyrhizobium diazoefficiens]WLB37988.1 hypothetical protein QIH78_42755 [Bradyrhizobium diazoefficiens]WLC17127.1 hypothetical protein QIH76_01530 [Bradyrhizobium diazoefficiens]
MDCETIDLRLIGTKRLLMHNGQLADPLADATKALARLTGKSAKTEADHLEIGRIEWNGSLWLDGGRPCVPSEALIATFVGAAQTRKRGDGARARAGLVVTENALLDYPGPKDLDQLWLNPAFRLRTAVRVKGSRTMRTRPRFDDWSLRFTARYLPTVFDRDEVVELYRIAGFMRGLGDWRPLNGTFEVEVMS